MAKQVGLAFILLLCACPCSAKNGLQPACADICRSYTRDDVNHSYCVIACREASASRDTVNSVGYSHPNQLPNYFQNDGREFSMQEGSEGRASVDYYNSGKKSQGDGEDYEDWLPAGSYPKRPNLVIWRKTTEGDPTYDGMSFIQAGRPSLLHRDGKAPVNELDKRASSFVRIGRAPYPINREQDGPYIEVERPIWKDESDQTLELGSERPNFIFESGRPLMEEQEQKRVSSFVRIGRLSPGDKRASSFVRIGRSHLDVGEKRAGSILDMEKSLAEADHMTSSVNRVRKSLKENDGKRASSFVRIGKSQNYPETTRSNLFALASKSSEDEENGSISLAELGKPHTSVETKRSSILRVEKSPYDEVGKRASSFVRIGKSLLDEAEKRASSFVRIGKSSLGPDVEQKRASSFVRIGKSPVGEEEKRVSSFVRIGKASLDEEEKRASSFVRIGKSLLDEAEKRASSFVRIGKSPRDEDNKRASSFVRIGRTHPDREEKRASSFVRIGKSPLDEENGRTLLGELEKSSPSAHKKTAGSLLRKKKRPAGDNSEKRANSLTGRTGGSSKPGSDKFQLNRHSEGKRYSAYWRFRKPVSGKDAPMDRDLFRVPKAAVESLLEQNAAVNPLLSNRLTNQILWIPAKDDERRYMEDS